MFALIPAVSGPLLHDVHDKTFRLAKGRACALPPATAASCPEKFFLCASVVSRYVALESMALILRRLVSARFLDVVNREKNITRDRHRLCNSPDGRLSKILAGKRKAKPVRERERGLRDE